MSEADLPSPAPLLSCRWCITWLEASSWPMRTTVMCLRSPTPLLTDARAPSPTACTKVCICALCSFDRLGGKVSDASGSDSQMSRSHATTFANVLPSACIDTTVVQKWTESVCCGLTAMFNTQEGAPSPQHAHHMYHALTGVQWRCVLVMFCYDVRRLDMSSIGCKSPHVLYNLRMRLR